MSLVIFLMGDMWLWCQCWSMDLWKNAIFLSSCLSQHTHGFYSHRISYSFKHCLRLARVAASSIINALDGPYRINVAHKCFTVVYVFLPRCCQIWFCYSLWASIWCFSFLFWSLYIEETSIVFISPHRYFMFSWKSRWWSHNFSNWKGLQQGLGWMPLLRHIG